jgi:glycosyltransferase involved in cell wall biosynthesis
MEFSQEAVRVVPDVGIPAVPSREAVRRIRRIALIGNHLPRRCGIATYTSDVAKAMAKRFPDVQVDIWAMNDGKSYDYPGHIAGTIEQDDVESYLAAARQITASGADMVWVQHEFGIFGGKAGEHIVALIERLTMPVVVALHTVLEHPTRDQRRVMLRLVEGCKTLIVMAEDARRILIERYGAAQGQVVVIPHGVPDRPMLDTEPLKHPLGLGGRDVILTFGLLSPGKGIETMIRAMPEIVAAHPSALYLILGATHPHCIEWHGENYRTSLIRMADELGLHEHVRFIDAFFETDELLDYLAAADIYVTPYLNPAQVTSGTLAYAVGLGKPIVSTPYVHAREVLSDGNGRLVDFEDSDGFAAAIISLLDDNEARETIRRRTYSKGRSMIWPRLAEASMERFEKVAAQVALKPALFRSVDIPNRLPELALERMCDATGMLQHSIFGVPHRDHGYCIDDNARALLLGCKAEGSARECMPVFAAFVAQAWNPAVGRFRNFMAYDRRWLEDAGSDDSNGRTLWALAGTASLAADTEMQLWAAKLFDEVLEPLSTISSPRAQAYMMLAAAQRHAADPGDPLLSELITRWGEGLSGLHGEYRKPGWEWFEPVLAYDNARLCEAMIGAGVAMGRDDFVRRGLSTLDWLTALQTTEDGHFRAVGTDTFGELYALPMPFDQQPIEAWATIDACDAAFDATGEPRWQKAALNAYRWFLGKNELGIALGDPETGECYDGLTPTGVNRNRGAESILAFHHATAAIQKHRDA